MTYRLFTSPRGFSNEGTVYEFADRPARDAAFAHLRDIGYADGNRYFRKITEKETRAKLKGDAATESNVCVKTLVPDYAGWTGAAAFAYSFNPPEDLITLDDDERAFLLWARSGEAVS